MPWGQLKEAEWATQSSQDISCMTPFLNKRKYCISQAVLCNAWVVIVANDKLSGYGREERGAATDPVALNGYGLGDATRIVGVRY